MLGLWKGLGPNIARNAIINAAELASYDQIKQSMLASGMFTVRKDAADAADTVLWMMMMLLMLVLVLLVVC